MLCRMRLPEHSVNNDNLFSWSGFPVSPPHKTCGWWTVGILKLPKHPTGFLENWAKFATYTGYSRRMLVERGPRHVGSEGRPLSSEPVEASLIFTMLRYFCSFSMNTIAPLAKHNASRCAMRSTLRLSTMDCATTKTIPISRNGRLR